MDEKEIEVLEPVIDTNIEEQEIRPKNTRESE